MADDLGERTEQPTPKRLQDARRDGTIAKSMDLSSAVLLLAATLVVAIAFLPMLGRFKALLEAVLLGDTLGNPVDPAEAQTVIEFVAIAGARIALPVLLATALVAYLSHFFQVGWLFSLKIIQPNLAKLNPIAGFKRLAGVSGLFRAGMGIVKLAFVTVVVVLTIHQYADRIVVLAYLSPMGAMMSAAWMMMDLALRLLAVLLVLGVLDLLYQRWKHVRDLRMTKHQVKEEMKQTEGDPAVKRRRLRMQQQITMQRIASAVPRADVIVTNPEHISIAIQYDSEQMLAPMVVAKGADYVALRIRQLALVHRVPIVERPPLARALYRQVAVGGEIPPAFYHAVAEILAYVYRLGERRAG